MNISNLGAFICSICELVVLNSVYKPTSTFTVRSVPVVNSIFNSLLVLKVLKGTVSRDFLLLVFFMNQFPPSP
jgi:hypothetical protein